MKIKTCPDISPDLFPHDGIYSAVPQEGACNCQISRLNYVSS